MLPVDEDGKEIPAHPDDPRFDKDGNPKKEWVKAGGAKAWALRNSRWNPETGEFEYYADLPDFHKDPETGRWRQRPSSNPIGALPKDERKDGSLPPVEQNDPPDVPHPGPPGPPYVPILPPFLGKFPRPRRK